MFLNTDCPICGSENAYFNGVEYECPDCGKTWPCSVIPEDDSEEDDNDF